MEQSIALRLSSMISICTVHSGSLMETAYQFWRKVLCAPGAGEPSQDHIETDIPPPGRSKPNPYIGPDCREGEGLAAGLADPAGLADLGPGGPGRKEVRHAV